MSEFSWLALSCGAFIAGYIIGVIRMNIKLDKRHDDGQD